MNLRHAILASSLSAFALSAKANETLFFQHQSTLLSSTYTNPYSGAQATVSRTVNLNSGTYPGDPLCFSQLVLTTLDDVLFLSDPFGTPVVSNIDSIQAGFGDDLIILADATLLYGNITIVGGSGDDVIWTNAGDDFAFAGEDNDIVDTGPGADTIYGDSGDDCLSGGDGDDSFVFGDSDGTDWVNAGAGTDEITFVSGIRRIDIFVCPITAVPCTGGAPTSAYEITFRNGPGVIRVSDDGPTNGLETVRFADGQTFDLSTFPSPADLDANGSLNIDDIDAFVAGFVGSDPSVDYDNNGAFNIDDIDAFIAAFLRSCP